MTATAGKYFASTCSTLVSTSFSAAGTTKLTFSSSTSVACIAFGPSCSMVIIGLLQTRKIQLEKSCRKRRCHTYTFTHTKWLSGKLTTWVTLSSSYPVFQIPICFCTNLQLKWTLLLWLSCTREDHTRIICSYRWKNMTSNRYKSWVA